MAFIILNKRDTAVTVKLAKKTITIPAREMSDRFPDSENSPDLKRKEAAGDVVVSHFEEISKPQKRQPPKGIEKKVEPEDKL